MKNLGMLVLVVGLALGGYSLFMDVSIDVPARDFGYGVGTPAMQVANLDRMAQRQNFMIFSGILSVVGAILLGFGSIHSVQSPARRPEAPREATSLEEDLELKGARSSKPQAVSICPKCRHMGEGDDIECGLCGEQLQV
ncbi:hypothetical protein ABIE30_000656 [Janthinobacterium lividum]|uniref:hypothetical protein n=1 Tax=Janthinobacterium lividum TaxID=29581 RepID=UPI003D190905